MTRSRAPAITPGITTSRSGSAGPMAPDGLWSRGGPAWTSTTSPCPTFRRKRPSSPVRTLGLAGAAVQVRLSSRGVLVAPQDDGDVAPAVPVDRSVDLLAANGHVQGLHVSHPVRADVDLVLVRGAVVPDELAPPVGGDVGRHLDCSALRIGLVRHDAVEEAVGVASGIARNVCVIQVARREVAVAHARP